MRGSVGMSAGTTQRSARRSAATYPADARASIPSAKYPSYKLRQLTDSIDILYIH